MEELVEVAVVTLRTLSGLLEVQPQQSSLSDLRRKRERIAFLTLPCIMTVAIRLRVNRRKGWPQSLPSARDKESKRRHH